MIPEPWVSQTVTEGSLSCGCLGKKICCGSAGVFYIYIIICTTNDSEEERKNAKCVYILF